MVTEYKRDMYCFRVHPNYHNTGRWQDWVPIQFKGYEEPHPCRIEAIIPGMLNRNHLVLDDYKMVYLVVTCCTEIKQACSSVLFDIWKYNESAYHLVEATTIVAPCYVVKDTTKEEQKCALVTLDVMHWSNEFVELD